MRASLLFLLLLLCLGSVAYADEPVTLAFKFAEGSQISYDMALSGAGRLTAPGAAAMPLLLQGTMTLTQCPSKVDADGAAVLDTLMSRADFTVSIGDKKARFTYADGAFHWYLNGQEKTPPQADLSKAPLFSSPVQITMKPDGTVTAIGFADAKVMDALRKLIPNLGESLSTPSSVSMFPDKPVAVGESWTQDGSLPAAGGFTGTYTSRSTLESLDASGGMTLAKLSGLTEVKLHSAPQTLPAPGGQQFSFSLPEMKEAVVSTEFFNVGAGRMVRGDYDLQFSMKIKAGIGSTTDSGAMDLRLKATMVAR